MDQWDQEDLWAQMDLWDMVWVPMVQWDLMDQWGQMVRWGQMDLWTWDLMDQWEDMDLWDIWVLQWAWDQCLQCLDQCQCPPCPICQCHLWEDLWDHPHILVWEDKVLVWDTVDPVQDTTAWEDQAQSILGWEVHLQVITVWEDQVLSILVWGVPVQSTQVWDNPLHSPCHQRKFIQQINQWCSIHKILMHLPSILVASVTKKFMTMIRQYFVNLVVISGFTEFVQDWRRQLLSS